MTSDDPDRALDISEDTAPDVVAEAVVAALLADSPRPADILRRPVTAEFADSGLVGVIEQFIVEPTDQRRIRRLAQAIAWCIHDNPDFGTSLVAALTSPPTPVLVPADQPVGADGAQRRWITFGEVRSRWPMIRISRIAAVATKLKVARTQRQTGPPRHGTYGIEIPRQQVFDADDVERIAAGLAAGDIEVPPDDRVDTRQGRAAERRRVVWGVLVIVGIVALIGLLCAGLIQAFTSPTRPGTDCGDCGWH